MYKRQKPLISVSAGMGGFLLVEWIPPPGHTDTFLWLRDPSNHQIAFHPLFVSDENVTLLTTVFRKGKVFVFGS